MLNAVLDSTILVSAFLRKKGLAAQLLDYAVNGAFEFYFTEAIIEETCNVLLNREHLRLNFPYTNNEVEEYRTLLRSLARAVGNLPAVNVCRDPNDDYVIATALAAGVLYLVTYDKDLLDLKSYQAVQMIRPEAFIHLVRGQAPKP
ncbi:MAG TPA: putative toxin-antitoxin system toxin component, PIN family [Candidatus Binatia bacterium]|jgi:putative PIN family toxin of toxin-antitoxin system|nr:putative toxin-antitoxin system toxin component, PIN family [Candidatus Binatia bacterium]